MHDETLDRHLHDIMTVGWRAYRESVQKGDAKCFNEVFAELTSHYPDGAEHDFVIGMVLGLTPALNRQIGGVHE